MLIKKTWWGCMFSGKTTNLIKKYKKCVTKGKKCLLIKHSKDTRYSTDCVQSHDSVKYPATPFEHLMDAKNIIPGYDKIFIEEGQFFDDILDFCELKSNAEVYVAGLDKKFNKEDFGKMPQIIKKAKKPVQLFAKCSCGANAIYTSLNKKMITNLKEQIIIGGSEKYTPMCGCCYDKNN
jgi:thymidine kinase